MSDNTRDPVTITADQLLQRMQIDRDALAKRLQRATMAEKRAATDVRALTSIVEALSKHIETHRASLSFYRSDTHDSEWHDQYTHDPEVDGEDG